MPNANSPLLFIISEPVGSPIANQVAYRLADQGVRTWIGSLAPAGELNETAMEALRASVATLLVFDRAATGSRHVDRHLLVARQTGKPLIPLRVEAADEGLLRQELLDAQWIDWSAPDAAVAEIRRRAYQYDPAQPGHAAGAGAGAAAAAGAGIASSAPSAAHEVRKPQIEVLRVGPAAAPDPHGARVVASGPEAAAASAVPGRSRSRFASPTLLLALLALLAIVGAILYNSSLFSGDRDRTEREVATRTEPVDYPPAAPSYDEALPASDTAPPVAAPGAMEPAPAPVPAAEAPSVPPAAPPAAAEQPARPNPAQTADADAAPSPEPASEGGAGGQSALATVRAFYSALSGGDGASAAQLVVPDKRRSGPLSAGSLSSYFSSFRRPLRVRRATPVGANSVRVAYDYVLSDGRLCQGEAVVDVVQSGGRPLVSGIRTRGPC